MGWGRCSIEALSLLKKAAAIRPGFDLRNEAIATLSLADVAPEKQWTNAKDSPFGPLAFDPTLQFCASALPGQTVSIWKFADRQPVCILKADDGDRTRACTLGPWDGTHLCLGQRGRGKRLAGHPQPRWPVSRHRGVGDPGGVQPGLPGLGCGHAAARLRA